MVGNKCVWTAVCTACWMSTWSHPTVAQAPLSNPTATENATKPALTLKEVGDKLEGATGERLDVELKTGQAFVRSEILKVTRDQATGEPKAIKIKDGTTGKPVSVGFRSIRSLALAREPIYVADDGDEPTTARGAKAEKEEAARSKEWAEWVARAKLRGVEPWPEHSAEEQKAFEQATRRKIEKIQAAFPGLMVYETHEFLFLSDMPAAQVAPYVKSLDKMYDLMCDMYGIKRGTPMWQGKCLVVAFLDEVRFLQFEATVARNDAQGAQGICHSSTSGNVYISCFRGESPAYFGQVLVHETSHGFIHRYRTAEQLPSWANEGMAEWIAKTLIPSSHGVASKERLALEAMRATGSLQGLLDADPIQSLHYGMASLLTDYLIRTDKKKYAQFVSGVKEGMPWPESLKTAYKITPDQLVSAFGGAIGLPNLRP